MNFLEGKIHDKSGRLKCVAVIKFTDNIRFKIDHELFRTALHFDGATSSVLKVKAKITEIGSGVQNDESVSFTFDGYFRSTVEGKVLIDPAIQAKDFDRYVKMRPYLITFYWDEMTPFT